MAASCETKSSSDIHDDSETIIKKVNLDRQIEP